MCDSMVEIYHAKADITQGQNTEIPKVYNSVNYSSLQKCKPLLMYQLEQHSLHHNFHDFLVNYDVNYVVQISTSTGVYISVNYCS